MRLFQNFSFWNSLEYQPQRLRETAKQKKEEAFPPELFPPPKDYPNFCGSSLELALRRLIRIL
jgi:hypothetical protein